jgi:hypothetical protein
VISAPGKWFSSPRHYGDGVEEFLKEYLAVADRKCLLIAAAGFDPRCLEMPKLFKKAGGSVKMVLLREMRISEDAKLVESAKGHIAALEKEWGTLTLPPLEIEIFAPDNHVIAGPSVVKQLQKIDISAYTDIFVDVSAMSIGVSFPLAKLLWQQIEVSKCKTEVHVVVASARDPGDRIKTEYNDRPGHPKGYDANGPLVGKPDVAVLWLPQLAYGLRDPLDRIFREAKAHQTCPILPFPASDSHDGDNLMFEYASEFETPWMVDQRDIVYAASHDPHDLYRSLCRVHQARQEIFAGKSQLVISPFGSKALAVGAMMAAMEHNLRIDYLEAVKYECADLTKLKVSQTDHVHIWLHRPDSPLTTN